MSRGPSAYRPDIDGLRAVAVLAVILFHFDVPPFTGGFVGVDVFFVISGYLITAIIAAEMREGRFSIVTFYERRLRRIVPALLLVVLTVTVASLFVFLPGDLRFVGTSLMNAATFTSNILFYAIANDYFASDTLDLTPVLHSWSLGVEAQFYLVYPWLLLGLRRRSGATGAVLAGLSALSFAAAAWGAFEAPTATFYLLPARGWELLSGALLALRPPRAGSQALGFIGLAMIAIAVFAFSPETPFPGAAALLPCGGAVLVLCAGFGDDGRPGATRLLSSAAFVFLGRISYSLYLWHWPLLVFARYGRSGPLPPSQRAALIGLALLLATATWWWVERPFVTHRWLAGRRRLFLGAAIGTAVALGAAFTVEQAGHHGFAPSTLPADVAALARGQYDAVTGECGPDDLAAASAPPCRFGAAGRPPTVVLWGNSYARMWTPTLDLDAKANDAAGVSLLLSKCFPLLGVRFPHLPGCEAFNDAAFAFIKAHPTLRTVVLAANWFAAGPELDALDKGLSALTALGVRIVVVLAPPEPAFPVPRTLAMAALRHEPPPPPIDEAQARAAQRESLDRIERLRQTYGFAVVDPFGRMCDGESCPLEIEGHPVFFDAGHVSREAAVRAVGLFETVFQP